MNDDDLNKLSPRARDLRGEFLDTIESCRPALWRYCFRLTGSPWDAEDLVQDTLVRAFGRLAQSWQPAKPRPYLFRIATNAWLDSRRSVSTEPIDAAEPLVVDEVPIEDTLAALDYLASLLPPRQSVVVLLADVFEFHLDEVARMLSVSRSATKALLQRGRCTLRKADIDSPAEFVGRRRPAPDGFTAKYIDAFNRRDPDGIAALFHEDVFVEMLGAVGDLHGRQFTRDDALRQWAADPRPQWTEAGEFAGKAAMFVFTRDSAGAELLHRISRFEVEDGQALRAWEYYMAPELLTMAAHALGIEPDLHGYTFDELT